MGAFSMFGFEMPEILLIALIGAMVFGVDRIGSLAKSLGRVGGEFKKGQMEVEDEMRKFREVISIETE